MYAVDLRGHGRSVGLRGHINRFTDYHLDADASLDVAREESGGTPILLFAHSMGALLAVDWLLSGGGAGLSGVALSSPFLGLATPPPRTKTLAARLLSRVWPSLALPSGLRGAQLTRDPELAAHRDADPLNFAIARARWYTESMAAIDRVLANAGALRVPMILLYGGDDQLCSAGMTDVFASRLTMEDRTVERLPGHYHELVNEPPSVREPIIERYGRWLLDHSLTARTPPQTRASLPSETPRSSHS